MKVVSVAALAAVLSAQSVETVRVESRPLSRALRLPGELLPYQSVQLRARVAGFIERIDVDRGSAVRKGQLLATLRAPEMAAQIAEAEARVEAAESQRAEAEARRLAAESTMARLKEAAKTEGAVAADELVQAQQAFSAATAAVKAVEGSVRAARAAVTSLKDLTAYLRVTAPFDGVVTERYLHPGALAGPSAEPLVRLEQTQRLRLIVAVPEPQAASIAVGSRVTFTVPAHRDRQFAATVSRNPRALDAKTRTMPVEADVENGSGLLSPGMYPEASWPVRGNGAALLVPKTSVAVTTERTFVVRVRNGVAEWVNVKRGDASGDKIEVFGPLSPGDEVLRRGTDEVREGTRISIQPPAAGSPKK
ncbi:MAG: efflux RND transporter periplasmic adaptor subunit [Bryobacteraceae bacterium]|nr:efflux RND transporter periplasmic adaptor subunit [Bryobacteraceae bacterium]